MSEPSRFKFRHWHEQNRVMSYDEPYLVRPVAGVIHMQSTGIVDPNRAEIFEGDIVVSQRDWDRRDDPECEKGLVEWRAHKGEPVRGFKAFGFFSRLDMFLEWNNWGPLCLVGNMYEHPELLKRR